MAWHPTTRLEISGHRFMRRRIECALLGIDPRAVNESIRAPAQSLAAGSVLAIVAVVGCLLLAVLRPEPAAGTATIVMERRSGALFVRLGETLHPVLNLASARLIVRTNADPQPMDAAALGRNKLGPTLGIPGAPQFLGQALSESESQWTVCDGPDRTTVVVGGEPQPAALGRDQTLLVTTTGGSTYLLFDGHRAVVNLDDAAVTRGMGIVGQVPLRVSSTLLNLIPEAPPIASPRIPDAGKRGPGSLSGFAVGTVLRVARSGGDEYYVVLRDGVQRVGQLAAELVRFADSLGTRTAIPVAPDVIRTAKPVTRLPVSDFPAPVFSASAGSWHDDLRQVGACGDGTRCGLVFGWRPAYSSGARSGCVGAGRRRGPCGGCGVRAARARGLCASDRPVGWQCSRGCPVSGGRYRCAIRRSRRRCHPRPRPCSLDDRSTVASTGCAARGS